MAGEKDENEDLILVEVPETAQAEEVVEDKAKRPVADLDDKDKDDDHEDDEDDEEEARVSHNADDEGETDDQKRARRRAEKKRRREASRRHRESDKAELARLRSENEQLAAGLRNVETRTTQQDAVLLSTRYSHIEAQIREAETIILQARAAGNHADSLEAEQIRDDLRGQLAGIGRQRQAVAQRLQTAAQPQQQQPAAKELDPVVKSLAQDWLSDNAWVMEDSDVKLKVRDIDRQLISEGYSPKSIKFWNEMSKRVGKLRAKRDDVDDEDDDQDAAQRGNTQNRGPAMSNGGGGGSSRRLKGNEVLITPARKQAMQDAGAWDDPDKRKRMLKSFHEFDKQNPPNKQAAR